MVRPVMASGEVAGPSRVRHVAPSSVEYSMFVIAAPLSAPSVNAMLALPSPGVASRLVGASGAAAGVTLFDASDGAEVPLMFVAVAVKL